MTKKVNRIGLCLFHGMAGEMSRADGYFLKKMRDCVSQLYIVCTIKHTVSMEQSLLDYAKEVFFLSQGATALSEYRFLLTKIGREQVSAYDEIVFFDNSFLGPFYDLTNIFAAMQVRLCDFWGLLRCGTTRDINWQIVAERLSSGFLVVRSSLFLAADFNDFFSYKSNEMCSFLTYFQSKGYHGETYIDEAPFISTVPQNNFDAERYMNYELVRDFKYPFLKKDCFTLCAGDFDYGIGDSLRRVMQYIAEGTSYEVDLIWDFILRYGKMSEIYRLLHLDYVLPDKSREVMPSGQTRQLRIAVVIHLYYMDLADEVFSYIAHIPKCMDIIITSEEKNHILLQKYLQRIGREDALLLSAGSKGRDAAALLVTAGKRLLNYKYLCFIHDKKTTGDSGALTIGKAFRYIMWDNLLKSESYIENIVNLFEKNSRLGILAPPEPMHTDYFCLLGNGWAGSQCVTERLLAGLGVSVVIDSENTPFLLSMSFWCRTEALQKLFSYPFAYEDFPDEPLPLDGTINHAIERCLMYVAQDAGYFSGTVENNEYASLQIGNLQRILSQIVCRASDNAYFTSFHGLCKAYEGTNWLEFCKQYQMVYIYGAGVFGQRLWHIAQKKGVSVAGFIISDGQRMSADKAVSCKYLSQVPVSDEIGIVVAAARKYKAEIIDNLLQHGWKTFFCQDM